MAGPQPESPYARKLGRLDVGPGSDRGDLSSHDPGIPGPPHDRDRQQSVRERRPYGRHNGNGQHGRGKGEEHVGHPHQEHVDPAAHGARHEPDDAADDHAGGNDQARADQAESEAEYQPRQDVAPNLISAEPRAGVGRVKGSARRRGSRCGER